MKSYIQIQAKLIKKLNIAIQLSTSPETIDAKGYCLNPAGFSSSMYLKHFADVDCPFCQLD